jgi:hypothetical protein
MFEELFRSHTVVQRHLSSPLLQERLEYLQHCASQGYAVATLRELAGGLLLIQNLLGLATSSDLLSPADIQEGLSGWVDRRPGTLSTKMVDAAAYRFSPVRSDGFDSWGACDSPVRRLLPIVLCSNRLLTAAGGKGALAGNHSD